MNRTTLIIFTIMITCAVFVQGQGKFKLIPCENGVFKIMESQPASITCLGIGRRHNIYWSITGPSTYGAEIRLGECEFCNADCASKNCSVFTGIDNSISRPSSRLSMLRFVDNIDMYDGVTVKCSTFHNLFQATCNISVIKDYKLPQCQDGKLDISVSEPRSAVRCEGLEPVHSVKWILTSPSGQSQTLAGCAACRKCSKACMSRTDDVTVSRTGSVSELRIVGNVTGKENSILSCVRRDAFMAASCQLRVVDQSRDGESEEESSTAAVGGAVFAAVVVVLAIVIIIIILKKRGWLWRRVQAKLQTDSVESTIYEIPDEPRSQTQVEPATYASLRMSDVGLRSTYDVLGRHDNIRTPSEREMYGNTTT